MKNINIKDMLGVAAVGMMSCFVGAQAQHEEVPDSKVDGSGNGSMSIFAIIPLALLATVTCAAAVTTACSQCGFFKKETVTASAPANEETPLASAVSV